jgi:hypothetical protein
LHIDQQIPRPVDNNRKKILYSGKKKRHTVKTQFMINTHGIILEKEIDFILYHFDNKNNLFPRKMMTAKSNGQFTIYSKDDILKRCIESEFIDCRINAYPEYIKWEKCELIRQSPNFIFIDICSSKNI